MLGIFYGSENWTVCIGGMLLLSEAYPLSCAFRHSPGSGSAGRVLPEALGDCSRPGDSYNVQDCAQGNIRTSSGAHGKFCFDLQPMKSWEKYFQDHLLAVSTIKHKIAAVGILLILTCMF